MKHVPFKSFFGFGRRGVILIIIFLLVLVCYRRLETIKVEFISKEPGIIFMLQWTLSTTEPFVFMGTGNETFQKRKCPINNCFVTDNRTLLGDVRNFDVVLFHGPEVIRMNIPEMPTKRSPDQMYVFASLESSGYYPVPPNKFEGYFNLTWTYKLDSDIHFGYFAIKNRHGEIIGPGENIKWLSNEKMFPIGNSIIKKISSKKKAAAWFVSNCETPSKRENLVEQIQHELNEYDMSVDVYGRCGEYKCPRRSMNNCLKLLQTDYYFYFSFENSFAEDYVTEKLLHALNHYTVPVVFGGANYTRFMPDGAYLDATKLGAQELVRQMIEIMSIPQKYHDFFKWHNHYSYHDADVQKSPEPLIDPFCKLCEYINTMKIESRTRVVDRFENWWNPHAENWIRYYNGSFV